MTRCHQPQRVFLLARVTFAAAPAGIDALFRLAWKMQHREKPHRRSRYETETDFILIFAAIAALTFGSHAAWAGHHWGLQ